MPATYKCLAQFADAAANTDAAAYTVPAGTYAVVSTLWICNRNVAQGTIRVAHRINGAALANPQYLYYDLPIMGSQTLVITGGITMAAGDILSVRSSLGACSWVVHGMEVS